MRNEIHALWGVPGLMAVALATVVPAVPSLASGKSSDCICTLGGSGVGSVGSVTAASGDVFVNATNGEVAAGMGTELSAGSQLSTGANGAARATFGGGCTVALNASMTLTISPAAGGLCVALSNDSVGGEAIDPSGQIYTSVLLGEGALIVGSGLTSSTSN